MGRSPRRHTSEWVLVAANNGRVLACLLALLSVVVVSARAADDAKGVAFFETRIRPVLVEKCQECHSSQTRKAQGRAQGR